LVRLVKLVCLLIVLAFVAATAAAATGAAKRHGVKLGRTILLEPRTRKSDCVLGSLPDRRCSPGAYHNRLTKAVICSHRFHTRRVHRLPRSRKFAVEREYGLPAGVFRRALEIDHIVPLRLGGSNDTANLFPEEYAFANHAPGYPAKDRLDTRLHALVCADRIRLRVAQRRIAADWEALYREIFGQAAGRK
jgi:5-methylcytosine-specific restriction endonuclease McrA